MNKKLILYSVISGMLLSFGWANLNVDLIIFIALIPLLIVEETILNQKKAYKKAFLYSFITFFVWNAISTWWIWHATHGGVFVAILINATLSAFTFLLIFFVRKNTNRKIGRWAFLLFWLSFEYLYTNGEIAWVWLNIGNGLTDSYRLIQWYEYTGTLGGTAWMLIINFLIYEIFFAKNKLERIQLSVITSIIIFLPIIYSLFTYYNYKEEKRPLSALIIQPNIDPYKDKFEGLTTLKQLEIILDLCEQNIDSTIDVIVAPETAISSNICLNRINRDFYIKKIQHFLKKHDYAKMIIGAQTYYVYSGNETKPLTVRVQNGVTYEKYNSALLIDTNKVEVYHKSKLVVGVEKIPYLSILKPLSKLFIDLGGTSGKLGSNKERVAFKINKTAKGGPIICYESIFGEFVTEYVKKGANFLCIITNDGWWKDSPGHIQHLNFAKLRAIETRRSIIRSANTGISAVINQRGDITQRTKWWEKTTLKTTINTNNKITFYTIFGDYIGRISLFFSILLFLNVMVKVIRTKKTDLK